MEMFEKENLEQKNKEIEKAMEFLYELGFNQEDKKKMYYIYSIRELLNQFKNMSFAFEEIKVMLNNAMRQNELLLRKPKSYLITTEGDELIIEQFFKKCSPRG